MAEGPGFESAFQLGEAWELSLSLRATWGSQLEGLGLNALEEEGPCGPESARPGCAEALPWGGGPGPAEEPSAMQLWPTWGVPLRLLDHWWSEGHACSPRPQQAGFWPRFGCLSTARPATMPVPSGRLRPSPRPTLSRAQVPRTLPAQMASICLFAHLHFLLSQGPRPVQVGRDQVLPGLLMQEGTQPQWGMALVP